MMKIRYFILTITIIAAGVGAMQSPPLSPGDFGSPSEATLRARDENRMADKHANLEQKVKRRNQRRKNLFGSSSPFAESPLLPNIERKILGADVPKFEKDLFFKRLTEDQVSLLNRLAHYMYSNEKIQIKRYERDAFNSLPSFVQELVEPSIETSDEELEETELAVPYEEMH